MCEPLPEAMARALDATTRRRGALGQPASYYAAIGSTNDRAAQLAERGAVEGTMVVAATQTAGRGRLGRPWHSPPGAGLYVSIVIRTPESAPYLTLAGGVAVAQGITRATALPVQIKWPNDVIVPEPTSPMRYRKLAGILAEASTGAGGIGHVVLGLGINIRPAPYPRDLAGRVSSIEAELGRHVDEGAVLAETLVALHEQLASLRTGSSTRLLADWRALAPLSRGRLVEFDTLRGRAEGMAEGIDDTGALLVRALGRVERVIAGEVVWK